MSETSNVTQVPTKRKRNRSPSTPRPAFVILQLLGGDGKPVAIDKKNLKVVAVERSAEKVMEAMEDGRHPNAVYLRVAIPSGAAARAAVPKTPAAA